MKEDAEQQLTRTLLDTAFLMAREGVEIYNSPCRLVDGPVVHGGKIYHVQVGISVKEQK